MKVRRQARILALQVLYEVDLVGHDPEQVLARHTEEEPLPPEGVQFARQLISGVLEERERLDAIIHRIAPEWPIDQMAVIDRNILRMALFELIRIGETPMKVVINEAVELAKRFGSDSSRRFINGALGAYVSSSK